MAEFNFYHSFFRIIANLNIEISIS